jgi:uncharacterized protein YfaS (alpha-2-macroglobulin family)
MRRIKAAITFFLLLSIHLGALPLTPPAVVFAQRKVMTDDPNQPAGLQFRLSAGADQPEALPDKKLTPADPLSAGDSDKLLKRLPPVKAEPDDQKDFALRDKSLPPPRTGQTVNQPFPAPEPPRTAPPDPEAAGPLQVLRYAPEGEISAAPSLGVTFSQPMVAITSQEEAASYVPVKLEPQPPGKWRWLGTKTLMFQPDGRFPMATEYRVTVPAGTKSATGGTLAAAKSFTFATPPVSVQQKHPQGGPTRRDVLMYASFDQAIDQNRMLAAIKVASGGKNIPIRLATPEEIAQDGTINYWSKNAQNRWIAFRAVTNEGQTADALPGNATITVTIGPGAPSAEGPRLNKKADSFYFSTYGPLHFVESRCGYENRCTPFDDWYVNFTNPLDVSAFKKEWVKVTPNVPGLKVAPSGNSIYLSGIKKGRTVYKVTVDGALKDSFGQTLGQGVETAFKVGPADKAFYGMDKDFVVLDPAGPARLPVFTTNYTGLDVKLYKVEPKDWWAWNAYRRNLDGYDDDEAKRQTTPPGRLVFNKTVSVKNLPDELVETGVDLSPALDGDFGSVIAVIEPAGLINKARRRWERQAVIAWLVRTNIGLTAFADYKELNALASSLKDGKPLAGVEMSIIPGGAEAVSVNTKKEQSWGAWLLSFVGGAEEEVSEAHANPQSAIRNPQSAKDGTIKFTLPPYNDKNQRPRLLVARQGRDVAFVPEYGYYYQNNTSWYQRAPGEYMSWYVFDDRKLYRPGEEVKVKGWVRRITQGVGGDVEAHNGTQTFSYAVNDSRGNEIAKGQTKVNALGGFDLSLKLPPTANLGPTYIYFNGGAYTHTFQVQEFRRPEFEVTAQTSEGPHFVGGAAHVTVAALYFAGGGLANADANWRVTARPTNYTPPNWDEWTFGTWVPWWHNYGPNYGNAQTQSFQGKTDAAGKHRLKIDFDGVKPPRPYSIEAEATVQDVNRQAFAAKSSFLVHPARLYVGLKTERTFVEQGAPLNVQTIVTDVDGKAVAGRDVKVHAVRVDWDFEGGKWVQKETNAQDCVVKSNDKGALCTFDTKAGGGRYRVTARVLDDNERPNESEFTIWVAGGKTVPSRDVEQEKVELIPSKREFQASDVAELLVQSPFTPAEGVVTLRRGGLVKTERFRTDKPTYTLKVPIEERFVPNLHVQVDLVGAAARTDDKGQSDPKLPKRPAYASGEINLSIPPRTRKLSVNAVPQDKTLTPGGSTVVNVEVKDAHGEPVGGSEVAVVVVDESVLALTGYRLSNPLDTFYPQRGADVSDYHSRANLLLANPEDAIKQAQRQEERNLVGGTVAFSAGRAAPPPPASPKPAAPQAVRRAAKNGIAAEAAADAPAEPDTPINLRENFNALAVFAPSLPTDGNGRASVNVKLPDNLTRYRVMAVAVDTAKKYGLGESAITARQPLMVRPSAPRFLNFGDKFELPVVVQNQTDDPMTVDVAVRVANAELTAGNGRRVVVPANDRVEVRFPTAAARAGTARFQIGVSSGKWSDAAEVSLPVWTPATTEAFATYGQIDGNGAAVQPVQLPGGVVKQYGGLEITMSSTQLQELTDAVLYLKQYPYECSEQISSRVIAFVAMRDVLTAFKAKELPSPEELKTIVAKDLKRLKDRQRGNGGFGFWRRDESGDDWPYLTLHVTHALVRAKAKGYEVDDAMLRNALGYLKNVESHIPRYYSKEARWAISAYALNVRGLAGDRDPAKARKLIAEAGLEKLSLESVGWLLTVLSGDKASTTQVDAIRLLFNNRATETAGAASFAESYTDGAQFLLHTNRRTDGVILEALIGDQPDNDLIPKIVRGLLAHKTRGRWLNTQENVFILLALDKYFNTYEKVEPNFVARVWLGQTFAGEQTFKGRSTDFNNLNVPMSYLFDHPGQQNLIIGKEGAGRLYYRIGLNYAPADLVLKAADYGFKVERKYEGVDRADDVKRDPDGTWRIKAGTRIRVRLTMTNPSRRYHVALVDPLPAGLEILNPELATTGGLPADSGQTGVTTYGSRSFGYGWWWYRANWFDHQNFRDERAEAFTSLLWEGVWNYSYVARATTPGQFVVPPAKAEEMYMPETFGRSASDKVVVE